MTSLKEWMDAQWRNPGVQYAGHGVVYESMGDYAPPRTRAGTQRNYMDKETKRRRAKFAMYNEKLRPIILAEATSELRPMEIEVPGKKCGEPSKFKTVKMPNYTWPAHVKQEQAPPVPRKRVPKAK